MTPVKVGAKFPLKWKVSDDTRIFYKIQGESESSQLPDISNDQYNTDRPSTVSLEQFVEGVCNNLNNGQAQNWLNDLRKEDITTYPHLANLKFSEWGEIKTLSVNARKLLRAFVDQEKQATAEKKKKNKRNGV